MKCQTALSSVKKMNFTCYQSVISINQFSRIKLAHRVYGSPFKHIESTAVLLSTFFRFVFFFLLKKIFSNRTKSKKKLTRELKKFLRFNQYSDNDNDNDVMIRIKSAEHRTSQYFICFSFICRAKS